MPLPDDWYGWLIGSRFQRALAVLRLAEARIDDALRELDAAQRLNDRVIAGVADDAERMVAEENTRYLVELRIRVASQANSDQARPLCAQLYRLDPYCVEVRLTIGDAYAATGDPAEAAAWYSRAGELGTGSGAVGWFRAAQCYHFLDDRGNALNAMGRCLELDATAVEAKAYLTSSSHAVASVVT